MTYCPQAYYILDESRRRSESSKKVCARRWTMDELAEEREEDKAARVVGAGAEVCDTHV